MVTESFPSVKITTSKNVGDFLPGELEVAPLLSDSFGTLSLDGGFSWVRAAGRDIQMTGCTSSCYSFYVRS